MSMTFETYAEAWAQRAWNGTLAEGEEALRTMLRPDARLEGLGGDLEAVGGEQYLPYWRSMREAFPDLRCTVEDVLVGAEGRAGTVWFRFEGTHQGEFVGKPGTGKPIDVRGSSTIWLDEEGRATKIRTAWDIHTLLAQIGHAVESIAAHTEHLRAQ